MSIILDALKKLEQKKQRGSAPDIMAVHTSVSELPKRKNLLPILIVIILTVNVAVVFALFHFFHKDETSVSSGSEKTAPVAAVADVTTMDVNESSPVTVNDKNSQNVLDTEPALTKEKNGGEHVRETKMIQPVEDAPIAEIPEPATDVSGARDFLPSEKELSLLRDNIKEDRTPAPDLSETESTAPERETAGTAGIIPELDQLSPDIQKELPKISINGHIYSDNPSSRLVNINGHVIREGEDVTDNLRIEEITVSGIIFNYKDIRFRLRVF